MRRYQSITSLEDPTVNLTPLIDVVFVVLIMFIVVAPLLELDNIKLADASANSQNVTAASENNPISIRVQKDNSIRLNGELVNIEQLIFQLKQMRVRLPKVNPQLIQDREAYFGTYQAIKNAVELAGFEELDIILKPS